jgi:endonuclease-3
MGGLQARLARHFRTRQVRHWHLDQLLTCAEVVDTQLRFTDDPAEECRVAAEVGAWPGAAAVAGFGCSDCACRTHLYRFADRPAASLLGPALVPRLPAIYRRLRDRYENHALWERDPFRALVSCILSLRTQDPVTDAAADRLFEHLQTAEQFAVAAPDRIAALIYPVGMYRQKARTLIAIATELLAHCGGQVPSELEALLALPGVGRKTANLVRSFAFHLPAVCVDTHVHRITNRWGLVRTVSPEQTESELRRCLPAIYWLETNPLLVQHGQQLCRPLGPRCADCPLADLCGFEQVRREQVLLRGVVGSPGHPSLDRF